MHLSAQIGLQDRRLFGDISDMDRDIQAATMLGEIDQDFGPDLHHPPFGGSQHPNLRRVLQSLDLFAAFAAVVAAVSMPFVEHPHRSPFSTILIVVGAVVALFGVMSVQKLHLGRVSSIRSVEVVLISRATLITGAIGLAAVGLGAPMDAAEVVAFMALSFLTVNLGRIGFRTWIQRQRAAGSYIRPIALIGCGDESYSLFTLLDEHPEEGLRVQGYFAEQDGLLGALAGLPRLGRAEDAPAVLGLMGINGVIISSDAGSAAFRNTLVRSLIDADIHVLCSAGLAGVEQRRIRTQSIAREPFIYVEPARLGRTSLAVKRTIDVTASGMLLLLSAPVMLPIMAAIKLGDRGPVFFRQQRVGLHNERFELFKLRTMVTDAEARLEDLAKKNVRSGPLFKVERDPRVTRIGRILRITSLDEIPQLWNVIRGDMSLVGPRPSLPAEFESFDAELQNRVQMRPGVTGLWQVEARDNPAFGPYRRLDLFYIENASIGLDLAILAATVRVVVVRLLLLFAPRSKRAQAAVLD
ncbi:MAG: sugar transferase [Acidimicrobiia bacterium]|nr:sugar transferase [Acidimicrobiia bacterium]